MTGFKMITSGLMAEAIGSYGLSREEGDFAIERVKKGPFQRFLAWLDGGKAPLARIASQREDLPACAEVVNFLTQGRTDLLILGTGGSSLGAQVLCQWKGWRVPGAQMKTPGGTDLRVHFCDNLDPHTMDSLFGDSLFDTSEQGGMPWETTSVLLVSKSGGTPETMVQALALCDFFQKRGKVLSDHVAVLTEDSPDSPLFRFKDHYGLPFVPHPKDIGGRYSVLSSVGVIPGLCVGLDPVRLRQGAWSVLSPVLDGAGIEDLSWGVGAVLTDLLSRRNGLFGVVMMPYCDRLRTFSHWFAQLWAESLGKEGLGTQPIAAAGPVDQHSQMQLFLAGPRDKLMTVISTNTQGQGPLMPGDFSTMPSLSYLAGRTVGDVTFAQVKALEETFRHHQRPLRSFWLDSVDEEGLGALLMHFMLETILTGFIMGVDPFDQPAVEQGKSLTRQYLQDFQSTY